VKTGTWTMILRDMKATNGADELKRLREDVRSFVKWAKAGANRLTPWLPTIERRNNVRLAAPVQIGGADRLSWGFDEREQAMSKLTDIDRLFNGRHFDREVIVLCVRWYLRYKLSFRDLVEIMAERGLSLAHTTIMRWVKRFTPEFVKRWDRFAESTGRSWRVDETYVKVRGKWVYLYRAVDRAGKTVDFRLSARRDVAAAKTFFAKAISSQGLAPKTITLDSYAASHRAVREMKADQFLPADTTLRSSK